MAPPGRGRKKTGSQTQSRKVPSRKSRRKQERVAKKQKKALYHSKQTLPLLTEQLTSSSTEKKIVKVKRKCNETKDSQDEACSGSLSSKTVNSNPSKKTWLIKANAREKEEISRLEKLLKIKKKGKKKGKLPTSFKEDGLDYLLELTEKDSSDWDLSRDESDEEKDNPDLSDEDPDLSDEDSDLSDGDYDPLDEDYDSDLDEDYQIGQYGLCSEKTLTRGSVVVRNYVPSVAGGIMKIAGKRDSLKKVCFDLKCGGDEDEKEGGEEMEGLKDTEVDGCKEEEVMEESGESSQGEEEEEEEDSEEEEEEGSDSEEEEGDGCVDDEGDSEEGEGDGSGEEESDGYLEDSEDEEGGSGEEEEEEGNVNHEKSTISSRSYIPPHLRRSDKSEKLKNKVQGLLNRLSESNMKSISVQLEQLYLENSRNDMNRTLWEVLEKLCVGGTQILERFAMEHTMLVAILHNHIGTEVGAYVVQSLATRLQSLLWKSDEEEEDEEEVADDGGVEEGCWGKKAECLILFLAHLYNYRVIHCLLVYDVIRKLVDSFTERDVELLLLLLKNTGMEIRRDDSKALKDIILQIQSKAADSALSKIPRVKFMLDTIAALRTNNARKIPNHDPSLLEHMKKVLRGLLRSKGSLDEAQLKVSLQDLLNANRQGRWWVVGSAWTGRETNSEKPGGGGVRGTETWVLELAKQQRMNTDIRRTIFGVIMTSEDYVDCFQKLICLGLQDIQEREIVHVLVDCCLQEKIFNPYYSYLAQKLCEFKKANQVTFQYAVWDRFKALDSLTATNRTNLRKLCIHLITKRALSLSILKIVEFTELNKQEIKFFKSLLLSLLSESSEAELKDMLMRISPLPHLKKLRDSLLVFINHFVADTATSTGQENTDSLHTQQRIKIAEHILRVNTA